MKVSVSALKTFKACKKSFEFRYIEHLTPVQKSDALVTGSNYHNLLEVLYNTGGIYPVEEDYSKEMAMAKAYEKYIYPKFKVTSVETWMSAELCEGIELIGRLDGLSEDGCIVEHKTVSSEITEEYEYDLMWDEQLLAYMYMMGTRKAYYTVCRKPTIRQKKNETDEEFFNRMVEWYDEDTDSKIRLINVVRTDDDVDRFIKDAKITAKEMKRVYDEPSETVTRNTLHCFKWGKRCEYAPICLEYNPEQEYVEFIKEEKGYGTSKN